MDRGKGGDAYEPSVLESHLAMVTEVRGNPILGLKEYLRKCPDRCWMCCSLTESSVPYSVICKLVDKFKPRRLLRRGNVMSSYFRNVDYFNGHV